MELKVNATILLSETEYYILHCESVNFYLSRGKVKEMQGLECDINCIEENWLTVDAERSISMQTPVIDCYLLWVGCLRLT